MHGMLSSAIVLATFALAAGSGGYTAVWLYRATPGAPSRSQPGIYEEPEAAGQPEAGQEGEAARPTEADVAPEAAEDPQADQEPAGPGPAGEAAGARLYVLGDLRRPGP